MPSLKRRSPKTSKARLKTDWPKAARQALSKALKDAAKIPALRKLGPRRVEWAAGVHLVASAEMARLNEFYRGKKGPTDVLSFEAPEIFREQGLLGELVICLPVMKRQARELKHSPAEELRVLITHGVLHLLGMEHEGKGPKARKQAEEMSRVESRLTGEKPGLIKRAHSSTP